MRILPCITAMLSVVSLTVAATPQEYSQAMHKLATQHGCMACHSILPAPARPDVLPPMAPAWRDIALRYRDDPEASARLTRTVMTGSNPKSRHWTGKVSEVAMPANASVVTPQEARALVNWLLVLVP